MSHAPNRNSGPVSTSGYCGSRITGQPTERRLPVPRKSGILLPCCSLPPADGKVQRSAGEQRLGVGPVGWSEGVLPSGFHRSGRNSLPLPGSCHPGHPAVGGMLTQAQWAKNRGCL
jgi:hypothetical protein